MGAFFGAILLLAGGLSVDVSLVTGATAGGLGAVALCLLMKTRLGGNDR